MIQIDNLSKKYGTKYVLNAINISFEKGKVYGIFGKNGSGKTTFFKCLAELEPHSGRIDSDFGNLKNHLGFLFTEPYFFQKITGKEYIQLHLNARKLKVTNIETQNIFDLPLNQYVSTYSTGMKKKLALWAILLQKNEILILDEPFNGVDIESNVLISKIIQELKNKGKTILIASHIFTTLTETCDEIHWLQNGKFVKYAHKDFDQLKSLVEHELTQQATSKLDNF